jgi:hypothetical protein
LIVAAASSCRSLEWLRKGKLHIASTHLRDPQWGGFNLPHPRRLFANEDLLVVTFATCTTSASKRGRKMPNHYAKGGRASSANKSPILRRLNLTAHERADLIEFPERA